MKIKYRYVFADGNTCTPPREMPFNILRIAIATHGPLVDCRKVVVLPDTLEEIEIVNV